MTEKTIRLLTADDIECRIGTVVKDKQDPNIIKGVTLLLYKNARVDMAILDEVYTPMGWQRKHEFKDGKLYCTVSVWDEDKDEWIEKEDVGTESNTEAEKGQASDSFKRACVNWGIGRELYTAPFIYIKPFEGENIKYTKFEVKDIGYKDKVIAKLLIFDDRGNCRFNYLDTGAMMGEIKQQVFDFLMGNDKARDYYCNKFGVGEIQMLADNDITTIYNELKSKNKI